MSEETTTLQDGQTETLTGDGTVTTDGDIQSTVTGDAAAPAQGSVVTTSVTPDQQADLAAAPAQGSVVTTSVTPDQQADLAAAPALSDENPVVPPVTDAAITPGVSPSGAVVMYNGQAVTKRFGLFDGDGAEECELADGSTAFVPKSVLGE